MDVLNAPIVDINTEPVGMSFPDCVAFFRLQNNIHILIDMTTPIGDSCAR